VQTTGMAAHPDSFGARSSLSIGGRELEIFRLDALQGSFDVARLPFSLKILLENLLRNEDGEAGHARGRRGARPPELEFERNHERDAFLRWGQGAFEGFQVVPPDTGIVHQVNLEYLARVVFTTDADGEPARAYPDTLVGTDSHTTMINGLGVLGWGVGGSRAEAAMLGQPMSMLIPPVVGIKLHGALPEGSTATDLVLTVTQRLREHGVVGKFVEFYGPGIAGLPLADRATIGNMSPEFGSTCAIFPVDAETLRYLEFSGRLHELVELVEAYCIPARPRELVELVEALRGAAALSRASPIAFPSTLTSRG